MKLRHLNGLSIIITKFKDSKMEISIPAWLFPFDHGQDLVFYGRKNRERIPSESVLEWELAPKKEDKSDE